MSLDLPMPRGTDDEEEDAPPSPGFTTPISMTGQAMPIQMPKEQDLKERIRRGDWQEAQVQFLPPIH